jgi:hypothetical protein
VATSERGTWVCQSCGEKHEDLALAIAAKAPIYWENLSWFDRRGSNLGEETCVIKRQHFFVRGLIEIPIKTRKAPFVWNVWSSLTAESFGTFLERWAAPHRAADPPYEGFLSNDLSATYPSTLNLKLTVQTREPGIRPSFVLEPADHPLAIEQQKGISLDRVREINSLLLHSPTG